MRYTYLSWVMLLTTMLFIFFCRLDWLLGCCELWLGSVPRYRLACGTDWRVVPTGMWYRLACGTGFQPQGSMPVWPGQGCRPSIR